MMGEITRPEAVAGVPDERVVELDVREDLRAGREPFQKIMDARKEVGPGGALMLRAIFEPAPLYRVMGGHGFEHASEQLGDDDWVVWFWDAEGAEGAEDADAEQAEDVVAGCEACGGAAPVVGDAGVSEAGVVVLDVRGLEPPEPMVRTLAALESLPRGETLVQINVREPRFLLPKLDEAGFEYEVREQASDLVRVFIRHADADAEGDRSAAVRDDGAAGRDGTAREERVLDVRVIPPPEKHPAIFRTFGALSAGESFVLVNDHDPKPLRYQFEAEHQGEYDWAYLEEGPTVWRVEITRVGA